MRELFNSPPVYVELGRRSLKVLRDTGGLELPLERGSDGKMTTGSRDRAVAALTAFIGRKSWQPAVRAVCGISAQGVTLRRLTVPAAAKNDFESVLRLQIESEFPLSPDGLAWGWREISSDATKCEVLVAAVRKEVIEDYAALLTAAGLSPEFTVAALARYSLVPVAGGAVGNVIDRLRLGYVVDFIHAHAWGWSWYVFNLADAAIVCGVGTLVLESLIGRPSRPPGRDRLADAPDHR